MVIRQFNETQHQTKMVFFKRQLSQAASNGTLSLSMAASTDIICLYTFLANETIFLERKEYLPTLKNINFLNCIFEIL